MRVALFYSIFLCVLLPLAGWAQPAGSEFQVNTFTTYQQGRPSVATDESGNFVVVWESGLFGANTIPGQDGSEMGIFGQRYDAMGNTQGPEFQVNTFTLNEQYHASVASDPSGDFIVVWASQGQDGSGLGIFGQRFDASATPAGAEFQVNSVTGLNQIRPNVASDASGNFTAVWESNDAVSSLGVFAQRFDASANPVGPEFPVNTFTIGQQQFSSVSSDPNGNVVVVWESSLGQDGDSGGIFGQRIDSSGIPVGGEFQVNAHTTGQQIAPDVASDTSGNFVVVWDSNLQDGSGRGVFGQRYDASGTAQGPEFPVNTFTTGNQMNPTVAYDANGNFVVVWESNLQDGSVRGVFGQEFDSSGDLVGGEFQVNTHTSLEQESPAVAAYGNRNFIVAWQSNGQDGDSWGVFGQRYGTAPPPPIVIVIQVDEVNLRSKGMVPIVIQTTASFDAQDVDPATVQFGPNEVFKAHAVAHLADVDLDGDIDLVVHFRSQKTGIQCGDTEATLTGTTFGGSPFSVTAAITTTGCR